MKRDKIKSFALEFILIPILLFALFVPDIFTRWLIAIILFVYAVITSNMLKRKKEKSYHKDKIFILMIIFAVVYLGIYYLMGLYFGLVQSKILFSLNTLIKIIIPLAISIISTEIIRNIFLSQKIEIAYRSHVVDISPMLTFIGMVLVDLLIYTGVYDLSSLDSFLTALGFVLFSSISCNLLYNYVTSRYDSRGIIVYRLITTLFYYIIPIVPDVYIFLRTFLRMLYPHIMYMIIEKLFAKYDFAISYSDKQKAIVSNTILTIATVLIIMLVSCEFRFGVMVIGSRSMTGAINKGDAIIFEKYNQQEVQNGQVIIFEQDGVQTVHRVIKIENVNGQNRYYTKGDANSKIDTGYITKDRIYGLVHFRIKYIGNPTLWVRSIFDK